MDSSDRARFASSTSSTASFKLFRTSSKVSPCVFAPGSSSTKPIYPSGTFWKMAVSFMPDLEDTHDGSIPERFRDPHRTMLNGVLSPSNCEDAFGRYHDGDIGDLLPQHAAQCRFRNRRLCLRQML